jgi:hypothetical protein
VRLLYLDCFSGISGDMCLSALLDLGVPLNILEQAVTDLGIEAALERQTVSRCGLRATRVRVRSRTEQPAARSLQALREILRRSSLSETIRERVDGALLRLAQAEAEAHGVPPQDVHFHEIGGLDTLVDLAGTFAAVASLGVDQVWVSPLPLARGSINTSHGPLPLPAPATLNLLRGVPTYGVPLDAELVTPTGAVLAISLASCLGPSPVASGLDAPPASSIEPPPSAAPGLNALSRPPASGCGSSIRVAAGAPPPFPISRFGPPPPARWERFGCGAGLSDLPQPNVLRAWLGESIELCEERLLQDKTGGGMSTGTGGGVPERADTGANTAAGINTDLGAPEFDQDRVLVLETQLDDLNPELLPYLRARLEQAGAIDVTIAPAVMKKGRPGNIVTVLSPEDRLLPLARVLFRESSALGLRWYPAGRLKLWRVTEEVATPYGRVAVKIGFARRPDGSREFLNLAPEYEACASRAEEAGASLKDVYQAALAAARSLLDQP